jgi:hypothetical protein
MTTGLIWFRTGTSGDIFLNSRGATYYRSTTDSFLQSCIGKCQRQETITWTIPQLGQDRCLPYPFIIHQYFIIRRHIVWATGSVVTYTVNKTSGGREKQRNWLISTLSQYINTLSAEIQLCLSNSICACAMLPTKQLCLVRVTSAGSFRKSRDPWRQFMASCRQRCNTKTGLLHTATGTGRSAFLELLAPM